MRVATPRITLLAIVTAIIATLCLAAAHQAAAKTVWLCKPGDQPDPCKGSLQTTVTQPDGSSRIETARNARDPKIDCFYVYPTVSEQSTVNANKDVDPQQTAIAQYQAARYSEQCRIYAPIYRQLTLSAITAPGGIPPEAAEKAYGDVRSAWREYLRKYNHGRGVVLIGHSQGTAVLTELLRAEIERKPAQRRKLVSALLLGGNVTTRKGRDTGGSFRRTPTCKADDDTGCVVAFSTFDQTPPDDAFFGTTTGALIETPGIDPAKLKVVCTNPAALIAGSGRREPEPLGTIARGEPFPGTLGLGLQILYGGPQPTAATPWLVPQDHYRGRCVRENQADFLKLRPVGSARELAPSPTPQWGLHLVDANIALADQVELMKRQRRAYLRG